MSAERYTELIDAAQVQQDKTNTAAIAVVQQQMLADNSDPDYDGQHCIDCGLLIPKGRRDLGYQRDVGCQEILERGRSLHRRN
jgi:hypothetical protein